MYSYFARTPGVPYNGGTYNKYIHIIIYTAYIIDAYFEEGKSQLFC